MNHNRNPYKRGFLLEEKVTWTDILRSSQIRKSLEDLKQELVKAKEPVNAELIRSRLTILEGKDIEGRML